MPSSPVTASSEVLPYSAFHAANADVSGRSATSRVAGGPGIANANRAEPVDAARAGRINRREARDKRRNTVSAGRARIARAAASARHISNAP